MKTPTPAQEPCPRIVTNLVICVIQIQGDLLKRCLLSISFTYVITTLSNKKALVTSQIIQPTNPAWHGALSHLGEIL